MCYGVVCLVLGLFCNKIIKILLRERQMTISTFGLDKEIKEVMGTYGKRSGDEKLRIKNNFEERFGVSYFDVIGEVKTYYGGGFTQFSNDLFDNIIRLDVSDSQRCFLYWIIRMTIGWNRRWMVYKVSDIERHTNFKKRFIIKSVNTLVERFVLTKYESKITCPSIIVLNPSSVWKK